MNVLFSVPINVKIYSLKYNLFVFDNHLYGKWNVNYNIDHLFITQIKIRGYFPLKYFLFHLFPSRIRHIQAFKQKC